MAEAAEAAEDAYLSGLARDAEAELAAGATARPLSEVLTELDLHEPDDAEPPFEFPGQRSGPPEQPRTPHGFHPSRPTAPEAEPRRRS